MDESHRVSLTSGKAFIVAMDATLAVADPSTKEVAANMHTVLSSTPIRGLEAMAAWNLAVLHCENRKSFKDEAGMILTEDVGRCRALLGSFTKVFLRPFI